MIQFKKLQEFCETNNIEYNEHTDQLFSLFSEMLIEKNKVMNLTGVTKRNEMEMIHFIDSLEAASTIRDLSQGQVKILDIGTGAGFPGMPLAIIFPSFHFVLADALNKRIDFLNEVIKVNKIVNVNAIQARAEELGQSDQRESFDFCISRAVANMTVLLEYMLPMVKNGGFAILYKSGEYQNELEQAEYAMELLGGKLNHVSEFQLPGSDIARSLIIIEKVHETPLKYPRRSGKPSKSPLMKKS